MKFVTILCKITLYASAFFLVAMMVITCADVGGNILSGVDPKKMLECAEKMINIKRNWSNPFGDENTGEKIVKIIEENI